MSESWAVCPQCQQNNSASALSCRSCEAELGRVVLTGVTQVADIPARTTDGPAQSDSGGPIFHNWYDGVAPVRTWSDKDDDQVQPQPAQVMDELRESAVGFRLAMNEFFDRIRPRRHH